MKIKINNDYKCFMSIPNINFWYDYEGHKLFIGWLWWGIDLIFKGYDVEDADRVHSATMDSTSPELKESEDERIRKKLIEAVKGDMVVGGTKDKQRAIAWLEKQNKDGKKWIYEDVYLKEREQLYQDGVDDVLENPHKYGLEKQGEQEEPQFYKTEDGEMIEPKFMAGDWIIFNGLTLHVEEVVKGFYRTISKGGITRSYNWGIDNAARLWTIQDAKDGDVLVDGNFIGIFKENSYNPSDKSGCMFLYCSFDMNNDKFYTESGGYDPNYFYPATKEQRELLFQKMKEAEYKWDVENKELKKIHVLDEGKAEMDYCFTKMMNGEKVSLIDKDALVAEINRIVDVLERNSGYGIFIEYQMVICEKILSFLDTLEVKEVDLEEELRQHLKDCLNIKFPTTDVELIKKDVEYTARKFFELGLKAQKGE